MSTIYWEDSILTRRIYTCDEDCSGEKSLTASPMEYVPESMRNDLDR